MSDTAGLVVLTEYQVRKWCDKEILLQVDALGFSTEKKIVLKKGYEYTVRSIIPKEYSFTLFKSGKILITDVNFKEIEAEIWRKKRVRKRHGITNYVKL